MNERHNRLRYMRMGFCAILLLLFTTLLSAQPVKAYSIKNGRMYIQLTKDLSASALDSFITQYDLADLDLKRFIKTNKPDSLTRLGWKIELNNEVGFIISKIFEPFEGLANPADKILFEKNFKPLFPAVNNGIVYGANQFRNKIPFAVKDSITRFFLRNHKGARKVMLAGSFNNWEPNQLPMQRTDSGWIMDVKLGAGKYWYKFIVDGNWIKDEDNFLSENDGQGNINSFFYT